MGDYADPVNYYLKQDYIQTASGNKVSRKSVLCGSQNIQLSGRSVVQPGVILRGDLSLLRIGKYVIVGVDTVLRPPYKAFRGSYSFFPLTVGDYVTIGKNVTISAASVGSYVDIGDGCVISKRCIIKDNVRLLPGTMLPADAVVPPFTVFGGSPAQYIGDLPESAQYLQREKAVADYRMFHVTTRTNHKAAVEQLRNVVAEYPSLGALLQAIEVAKKAGASQGDIVMAVQLAEVLRRKEGVKEKPPILEK